MRGKKMQSSKTHLVPVSLSLSKKMSLMHLNQRAGKEKAPNAKGPLKKEGKK